MSHANPRGVKWINTMPKRRLQKLMVICRMTIRLDGGSALAASGLILMAGSSAAVRADDDDGCVQRSGRYSYYTVMHDDDDHDDLHSRLHREHADAHRELEWQ